MTIAPADRDATPDEAGRAATVSAGAVGPPPPFDVELAAGLEAFGFSVDAPFSAEDLLTQTRSGAALFTVPDEVLTGNGAFAVEDRLVPGPPGAPEVSLLISRPAKDAAAPAAADRLLPAVYFMHGGGMIIGNNRLGISEIQEWSRELGGLVGISVEYRLAPENPHPAPVEDCYAGLLWTVEHADELGIDPNRIVIAGTSAGGGLCAAVALLARDRGGPTVAGQLLMCPMLDDRNDTVSAVQMAGRGVWDRAANEVGWRSLLGDLRGGPDVSPYAAPARAEDLSNLPPAFVDVGSAETFRDEDVAYASRIWRAGGQAELHVWPGGFHGFDGLAPHATLSRQARAARLAWLRRIIAD
ncbi:alpha/beta hydrolase [Frankia sp. CNm7]|uniref:Alpha/beta hydrolase n=1 Tax=Frankia nepalensis TaxID=1836974 RepID=A0A937RIP3_9ACTN|nr:alpha/beta hydrolase [Frankia nepalensis]MBL7499751.1 alpha/beta hydrolase [Frankia nepalensis]MBL7512236.1 alpha/beta hydrolase [Frankia nepalensis]MBL7523947.1 alpha/beta hydrolase [Frankia nepalensis]MBL7632973.1 alpha/beta hydrolase [Frankia nepalensis]